MEKFSTLLESIYDCAAGTGDWDALTAEIAARLDADLCNIFTPFVTDAVNGIWHAHGIGLDTWLDYVAAPGLSKDLSYLRYLYAEGSAFAEAHLMDGQARLRAGFSQDFWLPQGIHSAFAAVLCTPDDCGMPLVAMGLYRGNDRRAFTNEETGHIKRITPHLARALRLRHRARALQVKAELGAQAIDALGFPLLIVDAKGKLFHLNPGAKRLLDGGSCGLTMTAGRVCIGSQADACKLSKLLQAATGKPVIGGAMSLSGTNGAAAKQLFVAPLPATSPLSGERQVPLALLLVVEPERSMTPLSLIGSLYGLTPAESRLAATLLEGKTPEEHAETAKVSINTVRTQLRSLLAKTGTRRQSELVGLLGRVPPLAY